MLKEDEYDGLMLPLQVIGFRTDLRLTARLTVESHLLSRRSVKLPTGPTAAAIMALILVASNSWSQGKGTSQIHPSFSPRVASHCIIIKEGKMGNLF